jgi:hypothetical protein
MVARRSVRRISTSKPVLLLVGLALSLVPTSLTAQSCVLTRLDSPVLSAFDKDFSPDAVREPWQMTLGWRYGYSFRHFVGTDEQEQRLEEGSQVVNNVNLADLGLRYSFNSRTSVTLGVPYLMATRSGALRNEQREVVRRYTRSNTRGLGDITLVANRLVWNPSTHRNSNLSLGVGVKLPTGDNQQQQTTLSMVDGEEVAETETADFSVQPGDGAFGLVLAASGYRVVGQKGSIAAYGSATYILEPEATNGVLRPGAREGETEVSASDQYVARLGLQAGPVSWKGLSLGLGGRIEGIPAHDLIGGSDGRRRPGYMISVEPSLAWSGAKHSVALAVPYAVERNRERSVSDVRFGTHGDAAFPDYIVLASYSRRF